MCRPFINGMTLIRLGDGGASRDGAGTGGAASAGPLHPITSVLRRRRFIVHAPRLHRGSLRADTRAVQSIVDRCEAPSFVVGHSYGGFVITGLTGIGHLVFVAAFVPANGDGSESLASPSPPSSFSRHHLATHSTPMRVCRLMTRSTRNQSPKDWAAHCVGTDRKRLEMGSENWISLFGGVVG